MGLYDANFVVVNGVKMALADYKKILKAKQKKVKKEKKVLTEINLLPNDIKAMMRHVRLIKSLSAYYDNAYRQWGVIARDIINLDGIHKPFVMYRMKAKEIHQTMDEIADIGKHNEKAIYQFVRKLSYQLDDLVQHMDALFKGISQSGVMYQHKDHECICGCGRRLGLLTLMSRSWSATQAIKEIIRDCQVISDNGVNVFDYVTETYNGLINPFSTKN